MKTAIFVNMMIFHFNTKAQEYLKQNLDNFEIYDDTDYESKIKELYDQGIRRFILTITSSQVLKILPWIKSVQDATFISTTTTSTSLRNKTPNLYFVLSTEEYYIAYIQNQLQNYLSCVVYNDFTDIYIFETVRIYRTMGFPVYKLSDVKNWSIYDVIILQTITQTDIQVLLSSIKGKNKKYTVYQVGIVPYINLDVPDNVKDLIVILARPTIHPQRNSYWNEILRIPTFSLADIHLSTIPFLLSIDDETLIKLNIMSQKLSDNGITYSHYLPLNKQIKISYNIIDFQPQEEQIIWLINKQQISDYKTYNVNFISSNSKKIKKVIYTDNFSKHVVKYTNQGYKNFILDGPSDLIKPVMKLNFNNYYVCPYATSPTLRDKYDNFVFSIMNDDSFIAEDVVYHSKLNDNKVIVILSETDNIDLKSFKKSLKLNNIKYYNNVDDVPENIRKNTRIIVCVKSTYEDTLNKIYNHKIKFPKLFQFISYGAYNTLEQNQKLDLLRLNESYRCMINYPSAQPFMDSSYSYNSIPSYIDLSSNFLDVQSIIFILPWKLNYTFGLFSNTA